MEATKNHASETLWKW